jgi:hypothetical protein
VVKDLLNPSDKQLMIREHPEMGIYVQVSASGVAGVAHPAAGTPAIVPEPAAVTT